MATTTFQLVKPLAEVDDTSTECAEVSECTSDGPHGTSSDFAEASDAQHVGWKSLAARLAKTAEHCRMHDEEPDGEVILVAEWCSVGVRLSKALGSCLKTEDPMP